MSGVTSDADRVARLRMDARYHRERSDLYRAKMFGPRATSPERMRELERACEQAAERLRTAEAKVSAEDAKRPRNIPCAARTAKVPVRVAGSPRSIPRARRT